MSEGLKSAIINLWKKVDRPGIDQLIGWLESGSDFFTAPCSTEFHLARPGGLVEHSLNVYDLLLEKVCRYDLPETEVTQESVIICALGHDFCKCNFYVEDEEGPSPAQMKYLCDLAKNSVPEGMTKKWASSLIEWYKAGRNGEQPEKKTAYKVKDQFPMGHGEKSVSILQDFIPLLPSEKLAIRWHMQSWDPGIHFNYPSGFPFREASKIPLVVLLFTADYEASQIIEKEA